MGLLGLLLFASVGQATAVVVEQSYKWEATGSPTELRTLDLNWGNSELKGNTFGFYDWGNTSNNFILAGAGAPAVSKLSLSANGVGQWTASFFGTNADDDFTGSITLGDTSEFGFFFSDGVGTYYKYALKEITPGSKWDLSNYISGMNVRVQLKTGGVTPSAVPIPGSILLLGSGLLGVVSIGRRRNKALAA
ncbi:MAG: hypothetical protein A2521_09590 [Deltaproteobacteria bacterium RIFOXYD12_FULL_57_12]|nr:MAG: hypothetical protein A2521_09590 [Deltaproteobacteria bacterium RIFOXYD12_FULL_57_12]